MSGRPVGIPARSAHSTASVTLVMKMLDVPTSARSWLHTVIKALREALALSFESMKSTWSCRPAMPPSALIIFTAPRTLSTELWNRPGDRGVSTSAISAMRMVHAVTPISVATGFVAPALAGTDRVAAMVAAASTARASGASRRIEVLSCPG